VCQVEDGDDFVMVMPRPQSSAESSVRTVDKSVDWSVDWDVDRTCDQVLSILKTNPRATLDLVANVVGRSVRGIEQAIKRLKKAKRIRKVGGKRFGHWEVVEPIDRLVSQSHSSAKALATADVDGG